MIFWAEGVKCISQVVVAVVAPASVPQDSRVDYMEEHHATEQLRKLLESHVRCFHERSEHAKRKKTKMVT